MHFNSRLQLVQENEVDAMVDQQALRAGNVRVIEISGASRVPIILLCPSVTLLSEIWGGGTCPTSSMAPTIIMLIVLQLKLANFPN